MRCSPSVESAYTQRVAWLVVGAALAGSCAARAEGAGANLTATTVGELRADNENGRDDDDNYGVLRERLNAGANAGELSGQLRLDGDLFALAPDETYQQNLQLERLSVSWAPGDWKVDAGDYQQQLGRGIVLSVRRINEAGVDLSIRGVRAALHRGAHDVTLFAGLSNPVNVDPINQRFVEDPNDLLAGGSYELMPRSALRLGVIGLYNQPRERVLEDLDFSISNGVFAELPALTDWLTIYAEADVQYRMIAGAPSRGTAGYLNADLRIGDFGLLAEGLMLHAFEQKGSRNTALNNRFDYSQPPTLERIDQEVLNNRDVVGGRVRAEYYFVDLDVLVYANAMLRVNNFGEASELHQIHTFTGAELNYQDGASRVSGSVGVRDESQQLFTDRTQVKGMWHLDADWLQSLWGRVALHLTSNNQFWTLAGNPFQRGSTVVGVEQAGFGGLAFELGYDTLDPSVGIQHVFYAEILSWEAHEHVLVRAVAGSQRGGIKCVAGICREYPAFTGVRAEVVTRF
jgi:hypothetical protein